MSDGGWEETSEALEEEQGYRLIDSLLREIHRLGCLVMETREEVDALLPADRPKYWPLTAEGLMDLTYADNPAMGRYLEFMGENAFVIWEQ